MYSVDFINNRLQHYQQRLTEAMAAEARNDKEVSFLRSEVHRWKQLYKNS
jgi:hypothetical protein